MAVVCLLLFPDLARADPQLGDRASCDQYAQAALAQYLQIRKIPGCYKGDNGRWHTNYDKHYGWCMSAFPQAVEREKELRASSIARCIAENGDHGSDD
jgi:hypothetical protein